MPSDSARRTFWARTKRLTLALLAVWMAVNLGVPWFARDLNALQWLGFPLGWWLASEGALLVYLAIIVVYAIAMDRLEAGLAAKAGETVAGQGGPDTR